jgi:hypothetical protein
MQLSLFPSGLPLTRFRPSNVKDRHNKNEGNCSSTGTVVVGDGFRFLAKTHFSFVHQIGLDLNGMGDSSPTCKKKSKAVPLHAMEALGGRGGIAPIHSRPRH